MNEQDREWLAECSEDCFDLVFGVGYRLSGSSQQSEERANEAVSFATEKAFEEDITFDDRVHCQNWMNKVALNRARGLVRTERRHDEILRDTAQQRTDVGADRRRLGPYMEKVLALVPTLPEDERRLIEGYYFLDMTLKELAAVFACSYPTVWRRLQSILAKLKELPRFICPFLLEVGRWLCRRLGAELHREPFGRQQSRRIATSSPEPRPQSDVGRVSGSL